ncbi:MAG: 2-oxo acid dehydrogenase subunit E2 [Betaproteobacteria bacterium]|nr:MAG: 2-oxo acid dehydrogenase subunit E2 [Betaproteobacteria bacterium]
MPEFLMPRLGADMTAGKLVKWLKRPGERIKRGDIIAIVETDKANVDVESFLEGALEKILVQPGDERLPVGTPLALIRTEAGAEPAAPAAVAAQAAPRVAVPTADAASAMVPPATVAPAAVAPAAVPPRVVPTPVPPAAAGERARISPAARNRALELRIDPATLTGTGPQGRITLADVERAAQAAPANTADTRQLRMREAIASAMARSKREIPHYYLACTIDLGRALAWLAERNAGRAVTGRLIYAVLLIKAAALALREVPELNGFWIDNRARQSEAIHAGIAISLRGGGLVAPALHHADRQSLDDLMRGFQDLVKRARAWSLKSSEVSDPTVTITSLGERGVESVFGIITPPQLALVGFGTPLERPWVVGGQVAVRPLITATLSGDHRATDGHRGALYLAAVDRLLQQPEEL